MEKKMTLEHLAPYLPYGLKCIIPLYQEKGVLHVEQLSKNRVWVSKGGSVHLWQDQYISKIKPILRSLSDLTKEIEHNSISINLEPKLNKIIPSKIIREHYHYSIREDGHFSYHVGDGTVIGCLFKGVSYGLVQLLIQWHFDVFGLIAAGLAVDINTIEHV